MSFQVGAQLYTVRNFCKDLPSFSETLKKVADIGYRYVQVSGCVDTESEWLKEELKKNDLTMVLTHTAKDKLLSGDLKSVAKWHQDLQCKNVGLGHFAFKAEDDSDYQEFKATYLPIAKELKEYGMQFCFHHHDREFKKLPNGNTVLEQILTDFKPDECKIIMDTFWVQAGGGNPADWIRKLKGRAEILHLKDFRVRPWTDRTPLNYFASLGNGLLNFDSILRTAEESDVKTLLVEQDDCYGLDPFDELKKSYEYLKAKGL